MRGALVALAMILEALFLAPSRASVAATPPHFPEREVIVAFVRVIPRGAVPVPGAVPAERLEPVLRETLTDFLTTHAPRPLALPQDIGITRGGSFK
jgi:non-ribosomal peptide synthetase component F